LRTDEDLMVAAGRGAGEAFEALFERYREPVWRYFRRRVPDAATAEELASETFLALLRAAPRYEVRAPFRAYLFGIGHNVLQSHRRKVEREPPRGDEMPAAHGADPGEELWVRSALSSLEPAERDLLMLREYEGLSYDEIAGVLRIPLNTVRSRLFRARMALRAALFPGGREVTS
jgi:RNA polymerase sigma-70 factor, ECF subfamily